MADSAMLIVGVYLDKIGWGPYTTRVFLHCGMVTPTQAWSTDQLWSIFMAYIIQGIEKDWGISSSLSGVISSMFIIGLYFGAYIWGILGDRYGRMVAFKKTVFFSFAASVYLIFSVNFPMMMIGMFFLGIGIGGEISVGGTVFSEFCPPRNMRYLTIMAAFWGAGGTLAALIALLADLTNTSSISSWRYMIFSGAVLEGILAFTRLQMVETPVYLLSVENYEGAERVLTQIAATNQHEIGFEDMKSNFESAHDVHEDKISVKEQIMQLFGRKILRLTLSFSMIYLLASFAYTGILYFMPAFLGDLSKTQEYIAILIQQFCGIMGTLLGSTLVETRLGRKFTFLFPFILGGLSSFLFFIGGDIYFTVVVSSLLNFFVVMGYSALYTITPESYPTGVRNMGNGWANSCARIGGILGAPLVGLLLQFSWGKNVALVLFAALLGGSGLFGLFLDETRGAVTEEKLEQGLLHSAQHSVNAQ